MKRQCKLLRRRQHYLPERYLIGFTADDELVALYDRRRKNVCRLHPKAICIHKDLYSFRDEKDRIVATDIEEAFANLEAPVYPIIGVLRNDRLPSGDERSKLALYVGMMYLRTPPNIRSFQLMLDRLTNTVFQEWGKGLPDPMLKKIFGDDERFQDPAKARDFITSNFEATTNGNRMLELMFDSVLKIAEVIFAGHWTILRAHQRSSFLTSDRPVALIKPPGFSEDRGVGVATRGVQTFFPLAPDLALLIRADRPGDPIFEGTRELSMKETNDFNRETTSRFQYQLIARDELHLESIRERCSLDAIEYAEEAHVRLIPISQKEKIIWLSRQN